MEKRIKNSHKYLAFILAVMVFFTSIANYRAGVNAEDSSVISSFDISFESGAIYTDGQYLWSPDEDVANHQFVYRIRYAFSDVSLIEPGNIKIYLPKHILKARNNVYADLCLLPMPEINEATGGNEFAYYAEGDYIIITNFTRAVQSSGVIDVAYSTSRTTYSYEDMVSSDPLAAEITVSRSDIVIDSASASAPAVTVDTSAELVSVAKTASASRYASWDRTWGPRPDDADQYYYVIWTIVSDIKATQPFLFRVEDFFDEPDADIVGFRLSGRPYFTDSNEVQCNSLPDSTRSDQVLTRHLKSSPYYSEEYNVEQYYQRNACEVTLTPLDEPEKASSVRADAEFKHDKPKFIIPTHGFNAWKYGNTTWSMKFKNTTWDIADYELTEFVTGERDTISGNVKYCIDTIVNPYFDTLPEDADPNDPTQYGQRPIYYCLIDDKVYFNDDITTSMEEITIPEGTEPLTYEDYEIDYITYKFTAIDAYLDTEKMEFAETSPRYADDEELYFEGKFDGNDEWEWFGTIKLKTRQILFDSERIRRLNLSEIDFKENCTAYRITTSNVHYKTAITAYPYYVIKRSDNILQKIDSTSHGDEKSWLTNTGSFEVKNSKDEPLYYKDIIGRDYFVGYVVNSSISKKLTKFENDNANKYATLGWKIDMKESYISNDGEQFVNQSSGTFYDYLPQGAEVNLSTVAVQTENGYLDPSGYDVTTVVNYNNTGRTMLIVNIKEEFKYASMTLDLIYPWESVVDYGSIVTNSVAYETGNDTITGGYPDDGGTITYGELMADLDPETDDEKFIYAESYHTVDILLLADAGLTKTVKGASEHFYSDSTLVHQNGEYTYKMRYSTTGGIVCNNMILYDSLENFTNDDLSSKWWGTLEAVDASQPELLGANPVVYCSSISGLDIEEHRDLDELIGGQRVWKTESDFRQQYGSLENAKAVAIDLRKTVNGDDFFLSEENAVAIILYMQAPPGDNSGTDDPKTYNETYASYTATDGTDCSHDVFTKHGYTEVTLRIMADINISKVSTEDNTTPIKGISFRLSGNSDYGTKVNQTALTDINGQISFSNIEKGTYSLTEMEGSEEYLPIDTPIIVVIDENGNVSFDGIEVMEGTYYTIGNVPRVHSDISFYKRDISKTQLFIENARFVLTGTSEYGNEVTLYAQSDPQGTVSFRNLELGTYTIRETTTAGDYILDGNVYVVRVTGKDLYSISVSGTEGAKDTALLGTGINGAYSIYNEPYHQFTIQKNAYADKQPIPGALFELKGYTANGTYIEYTKSTGQAGRITFDHLESGTYTLQETYAPYGFGLDMTIRTVTIDKYGNVTISDTVTDSNGYFVIENKENGIITITKKWLDGLTNEEREASGIKAVIHLTTDKVEASEATFKNAVLGNESCLVGNNNNPRVVTDRNAVKSFRPWPGEDDYVQELIDSGKAVRLDDEKTPYRIYAWIESGTGTVYWWSDAVNVHYNQNSRLLRYLPACTTMDVSGLNTSRMTSMNSMFANDNALTSLDLRSFDTSNVKDMGSMFRECQKLVSVDVRRFDTSLVTDMSNMFYNCQKLYDLDVGRFDTSVVRSMENMFYNCISLTEIDVSTFDTSAVENMACMFYNCSSLTELDVSGFDTSTVTKMNSMFSNCKNVTSLDVSGFDTSSVTTMGSMFASCTGLTSIDVSSFDTSSVYSMSSMFSTCTALTELDVSSFDTSTVNDMGSMFYNCNKLTSLDLSNFDTSSVYNMQDMFNNCTKLTSLDVSSFDTSSVSNNDNNANNNGNANHGMMRMFQNCSSLTSLDLSSFDASSCVTMYYMFSGCSALTSIDFGENFDASSCTTMTNMFNGCKSLTSLDLSSFKPESCTDMSAMFTGCSGLTSIDFGDNFDTSCVTAMNSMFSSCKELININFGNKFDTSCVTNMSSMFYNCVKLSDPDLSGFNTSCVTDMSSMFRYCYALRNPDLTGFDLSNVTTMTYMFSECYTAANGICLETVTFADNVDTSNLISMSYMFNGCKSLTDPGLSKFDTSSVNDMSYLFYNCIALTSLDISNFVTSQVTNMAAMFSGCTELIYLTFDTAKFDTSLVTSMASMFGSCGKLRTLDVSGFRTPLVTTMSSMFSGCSSLDTLDVSHFDTTHVTDMQYMFSGCSRLNTIDVTHFNTSNVTLMNHMFNGCTALTQLDVSRFDTAKVTSMVNMFNNCNLLEVIDVSGFVTKNVTNMSTMFNGCNAVQVLDVRNFNTALVTSMSSMFSGCRALTALDVSGFDTSNCLSMASMFSGCAFVHVFDVSGFDTTTVLDFGSMFSGCSSLTELDLSSFDTAAVTNTTNMFNGSSNLVTVYVSDSWNMNFVTSSTNMFNSCVSLIGDNGTPYMTSHRDKAYARVDTTDTPGYLTYKANPGHWINDGVCFRPCLNSGEDNKTSPLSTVVAAANTTVANIKGFSHYNGTEEQARAIITSGSAVRIDDMSNEHYIFAWYSGGNVYWWSDTDKVYLAGGSASMFCNLTGCTKIDLTGINTSHMTSMRRMFNNCQSLTSITWGSTFDTSSVKNMYQMFRKCSSLTSVDISGFDPSNVLTMEEMFSGCTKLTKITLGTGFHAEKVKIMRNMFYDCKVLKTMDTSGFYARDVYDMYQMFYNCLVLSAIDLSNFNTSEIVDLYNTFNLCRGASSIVFGSGFDTSKCVTMYRTFYDCRALSGTLDLSGFKAPNVTTMDNMFYNCKMKEIIFGDFDASYCTNMSSMFSSCSNLTSLDLSSFKPSDCTTMSSMFATCSSLTELILGSNFDTSSCTNMSSMFYRCGYAGAGTLSELDLGSKFDTSRVTNMASMFYECTKLETLTLGNKFDTSRVVNMSSMFYNCQKLTSLEPIGFNTSKVTNMYYMFFTCKALTTLDLSSFDTAKVTTMRGMFRGCELLTGITIDPVKFDTSKVTTMYEMFRDCKALVDFDLSRFNTARVTNMDSMFNNCSKLTDIDVSHLNTSRCTNMMYMFSNCTQLTALELSSFVTARVTNMSYMFNGCSKLTSLDLSSFVPSDCTHMGYMFSGCSLLESIVFSQGFDTHDVVFMNHMFNNCYVLSSLDLSMFDTHEVIYMNNMFYYCKALTGLDLSSFDTHEVTTTAHMFNTCTALTSITFGDHFDTSEVYTMESMFNQCNALTSLDLSGFDTSEVVWMNSMFSNCWKLRSITFGDDFKTGETVYMGTMFNECRVLENLDLSNFDTSTVTTMNSMFYNCNTLTDLDLSNFVTPKVWTMDSMFSKCEHLETLDVSNFDTRRVTTMANMFSYCRKLKNLDLSSFITPKLTTMGSMFRDCSELETLLVPNIDAERVESMNLMFYNCQKLKSLDLSSFHTPKLKDMGSMFRYCYELESLDVSDFDTSNITNMSYLFDNCKKLVSLDLESFNTYKVTDMSNMFYYCEALADLNVSRFFTSNVKNMSSMFNGCKSLKTLDLSSFDTSAVTNMQYMFYDCTELRTIYASNYWNTDNVTNGHRLFWNDTKLVGGNGTAYKGNRDPNANVIYAVLDTAAGDGTEALEGYLTYKTPAVNNSTDISSEDETCLIEPLTDSICIYTFTGLNPNVQYYAWEEDIEDENYIESNLYDSALEVKDLTGTITNRLITYDEDEMEYGSLSITKNLRAETGAELTEADRERMFVFTITLTDENNEALSGETLYGGELFTDGVAHIRIPGGVTMVLDYIPSGYHYTVTEDEVVRFVSSGKNTSGEIETGITSKTVYTNTKSAEEEKFNSFTLKKIVTGIFEIDADYLFTVALTGLHPEEEYTLSDGSKFTTDQRGAATIDVTLKNGEEITVLQIPVGSSYKITEAAGDYVSSYYITDANDTGNILLPTGSNLHGDLSLSTTSEYAEEDEDITVTFVNAKDKRHNVKLKKVLENASAVNTDMFAFSAQLGGLSPNEVIATSLGLMNADINGALSMNFEMAADDEFILYNLPVGSTYMFTEAGNEWIASYRLFNYGSEGMIASSSGSVDESGDDLSTAVETVNENEDISVVFTNTKVQRDITVTKLVDAYGSDIAYAEYSKQKFKFLISFTGLESEKTYTMQYTKQNYSGIQDIGSFTSSEDGKAEVTVYLTHGLSVKVKNLPKDAKYTVTEYPTINYISSYEINGNDGAVIVKDSDRNRKTCRILSTATETVDEAELDMNIVFTNKYYNDPTARVCMVTIEKQIDTKIEAFGTPTFLFRLKNLDEEGQDFTCGITLDGDKLSGSETISVTRGHYLVEEITVGRYASDGAEYLSGTTATQLKINDEDVDVQEYKADGQVFCFYLDMSDGEPNTAYLKFYDKLVNYSGVSHTSFARNSVE